MLRLLIVMLLVSTMCSNTYPNEALKNMNSSNWKTMTSEEKILISHFIGRTLTLDYLLLICNKVHPTKKDEFYLLSNDLSEKSREIIDRYMGSLYDIERHKEITKIFQSQAEQLSEDSRLWRLDYLKKSGITDESPSLKSCIDAIKNFPLGP
jgi:hypothetical protein